MLTRGVLSWNRSLRLNPFSRRLHHGRFVTSQAIPGSRTPHDSGEISKIRNIGIIAHIDAGKTTTTERMLYYSGFTRRIGNVDEGDTVTDFLPAERARGVTIQSAAISFTWPPIAADNKSHVPRTAELDQHTIQLIDTPGHADFTFEVQRSLRVLDGAVCILDAVAGVEAQTEKVWYQASSYKIPKIVYVNKLDREGAAFAKTVKHIASRLHAWPAVCQIPWWTSDGSFIGVGDVIGLRAIRWPADDDGKDFKILELESLENQDEALASEIRKARSALIELLSEHDEVLVERYLECAEDPLKIDPKDVNASLRRCLINAGTAVVPVFAGASFRNIGVQPLLDAIVQLLPNPTKAPDPEIEISGRDHTLSELLDGQIKQGGSQKKSLNRHEHPITALIEHLSSCALAFKVVHDARRGLLVYVRVYSGVLESQTPLFNTTLQQLERPSQLLKMYADHPSQVGSISAGQVGVIPGLKFTRTGDTLIQTSGPQRSKAGPPAPLNALQLRPIESPSPVFFASIEPHRTSEENNVQEALDILVREDPSLEVTKDEESGQLLLSGMGEFHLEIAQDRLINHFKAKARMGNIEISYRESILETSPPDIYVFDREQGGRQTRASCLAQVEPISQPQDRALNAKHDHTSMDSGNRITILLHQTSDSSPSWDGSLPSHLPPVAIHSALKNGALAALSRGINYPYQISDTHVILTLDPVSHIFGTDTTPSALTSVARQATKAALQSTALKHGSALMELYMNVVISCDDSSLGVVVKDLSSNRAGHVLSLEDGTTTSGPIVNQTSGEIKNIDVSRVYAPPDLYENAGAEGDNGLRIGGHRSVTARVPLKEMVGYLKHLRSLTQGRGTFVMSPDCFERVVGMREKEILKSLRM